MVLNGGGGGGGVGVLGGCIWVWGGEGVSRRVSFLVP